MVCLFGSYRLLTDSVGIEGVGLWSLLVAGSLIARLGDVSGGGGLARFVAIEQARPAESRSISNYIHTVTITTIGLNAVFGTLLWLSSSYLIDHFVDPARTAEASRLLPYAMIGTIFLAPVAATVCSAIDGTQRAGIRALLVSASSAALLFSSWLLIPKFGGPGFGMAQIIQQLVVIAGGWILLMRYVPNLGYAPVRWQKSIFRETVGFGLRLQSTALASLLTEPAAKLILSTWGGLAFVAYYELSIRFLNQIKSLTVTAAQPLVAAIAGLDGDRDASQRLLQQALSASLWMALGVTISAVVLAPAFSYLMLNHQQQELLYMICALAFGFGVNTLGTPFYLVAVGHGVTLWNFLTHTVAALLVLAIGIPFGATAGGFGVVAALVLALVAASAVTLIGNSRATGTTHVLRSNLGSLTSCVFAMAMVSLSGMFLVWLLAF